MSMTKLFIAGLILVATLVAPPQQAYAAYPDKPITFIVPFGAGGGFDRLARSLAKHMEKPLGVAIAIKNNPGSGGRRGSIKLFKSKNDGYTIGFAHFIPFLTDQYLKGKKAAIDYNKFAVIYKVSQSRHFVFVDKDSPYKSVADLKKAGKIIKFTSTGVGSIAWVEANALGSEAGFPVSFVTGYKSLSRAAFAAAKGEGVAGVGSAHHFKAIKDEVRTIMYFGPSRSPRYPNAPSAKELGYDILTNLGSPRVVVAPPGAPKKRLAVVRRAIKKVMKSGDFVAWAKKTGYGLDPLGPKAFQKSLGANIKIFKNLKSKMK